LDAQVCKAKQRCILEGEMLIWDQRTTRIEPCHKIRKYIQKNDQLLGRGRGSPVDPNEQFVATVYDILPDDVVGMKEPRDKHRERLRQLIELHSRPNRDQESEEDSFCIYSSSRVP